MIYNLDGIDYKVVIVKKNNKNLYIRVKEDRCIYVTCNYLTSKIYIKNILDNNKDSLRKMIVRCNKPNKKEGKLFYLGKSYDIIIDSNIGSIKFDNDKIIVSSLEKLNKWYKEETIRIFDDRYVLVFNKFYENVKSPILKIRSMKTRWGVYNRANHTITLNSKLIEYTYDKIDYVIIHELSHIIHFNHSKSFWNLVSKYCPDYKKIRKELKE